MFIEQQHRQAVHTHAEAAVGGHAIAHGAQIILVERVLLRVVGVVVASHFEETLFLIERIVQLGEGVAQLKACCITFEPFHGERITRHGFCQR